VGIDGGTKIKLRPPVIPRDSSYSTAHFHPFPSECSRHCLQVVSKDTRRVIIRTAFSPSDYMSFSTLCRRRRRRLEGWRMRKSDLPGSFLLTSTSKIHRCAFWIRVGNTRYPMAY